MLLPRSRRKDREADGHDHGAGVTRPQLWLVGPSGMGIAAGFLAQSTLPGMPKLATLLFAAATITGSVLILPHALESIRKFRLDMNGLMTVAVAGAWFIEREPGTAAH